MNKKKRTTKFKNFKTKKLSKKQKLRIFSLSVFFILLIVSVVLIFSSIKNKKNIAKNNSDNEFITNNVETKNNNVEKINSDELVNSIKPTIIDEDFSDFYIPTNISTNEINKALKIINENVTSGYKRKKIYDNLEVYPFSILDMVRKNKETIDFVVDYPEEINKNNTDLTYEYVQGESPHFIQWDKKWGYLSYGNDILATSGCGPTTLAMIIVKLTGDTSVNPKVVGDFAFENGYVTSDNSTQWTLMSEGCKNFGIKSFQIYKSKKNIEKYLKQGKPVMLSMAPGIFTEVGHFLFLTGLDENGDIIIKDSNSYIRTEKHWAYEELEKEIRNIWVFEKI